MDNPDIRFEPHIGHHVAARKKPKSHLGKILDEVSESLEISRRDHERIEIEIGDVDWSETKTVTLRLESLEAIVDHYQNDGDS